MPLVPLGLCFPFPVYLCLPLFSLHLFLRGCVTPSLSAPLSIALPLPFSLGVPYPQLLTPNHCHEPPDRMRSLAQQSPWRSVLGSAPCSHPPA